MLSLKYLERMELGNIGYWTGRQQKLMAGIAEKNKIF